MVLNFDILIAVMSFLHRSDLLPVMQCCRTLYSAGVPQLMKSPVILRSRAKILSFCRFVLIEPARFRHLRTLDISAPGRFKPGPKADLFLTMLMHAKELEHLKVADCEILMSDSRVVQAITRLKLLKSLALHAPTEAAFQILRGLQSELVTVELGFWRDDASGPVDPVPLLANLKGSLRELRVTYAEFVAQDTQYCEVETLVVDDCRFAHVLPLISCFPNLRDLSLWTGQEDEELDATEIEDHRQTNLQSQQQNHWSSLDHLRGDILSLYLLGVTCNIQHIDVQSTFLTSARSPQLATLLAQAQPCDLSLRMRAERINAEVVLNALKPAKGVLKRLVLHLDDFQDAANILPCLEHLLLLLQLPQLDCLVMYLDLDNPSQCLENYEQQLRQFSRKIVHSLPSLRRLFILQDQGATECVELIPGTTSMQKSERDSVLMYLP